LLLHAVNATLGQLKGQTLLPLPAADTQQQDQAAKDKAKIHILESAVMTWTKQIKSVLKADPDAALKVRTQLNRVSPAPQLCCCS
jgi:dynein heavy chain